MLIIETDYGNFVRWSDVLMYMLEEDLTTINVTRLEYCLDEYSKGVKTDPGSLFDWEKIGL